MIFAKIQPRPKQAPNFKRKVKASKRWKKASKRVAKLQRQVANQRQDWAHQVAAQIVSSHSMVAIETLNIKGMTRKAKKGSQRKRQKTGLNRSILDTGWGMLRSMIEYKLAACDGVFVEVPTQQVKPSQTCPSTARRKFLDHPQPPSSPSSFSHRGRRGADRSPSPALGEGLG